MVELEAVLGIRTAAQGTIDELEVLIQWKGLSPLEITWEPFSLINNQFPSFYLEHKVTELEGDS